MKHKFARLLAIALSITMVCTALPMNAIAAEDVLPDTDGISESNPTYDEDSGTPQDVESNTPSITDFDQQPTESKIVTVGTTGADYKTIANALSNVAEGDTIQLITPITDTVVTLLGKKNITLDLNGQKWRPASGSNALNISPDSSLTIMDSDDKGTGMIESTNPAYQAIDCSGTCTITGGIIKGKAYGIYNNGTLTICGGRVIAGDNTTYAAWAIKNWGGTTDITGGWIEAFGAGGLAINIGSGGTVSISGGNLQVTGSNATVINNNAAILKITGGKLSFGTDDNLDPAAVINTYGDGTSIDDNVVMNPEGKMTPLTQLDQGDLNRWNPFTAPIKSGSATFTAYGDYTGMRWYVYTDSSKTKLADGVSASSNGNTITLSGVESGKRYCAFAYDRAKGRGISDKFLELCVTGISAAYPTITKDLSTDEVTYKVGDTATALDVTATADDGGTLTYDWYKNTANSTLGGTKLNVTTAAYTPNTDNAGTVYYYCVVTNTISDNGDGATKIAKTTTKAAKITVLKNTVDRLTEAKELAKKVIKDIKPTNETDVLKIMKVIIGIPGVTVKWKDGDPVIEPATKQLPGTITGTIVLTCDGEAVEVPVDMVIPALGLTVGNPGNGADYATVAEAVAAASTGDKIKLITDISDKSYVWIDGNKDLTLDLGGKKWTDISTSESGFNTIWIKAGSTLTIKDSSSGGTIEKPNGGRAIIDCEGTMKLDSGTIQGKELVINARSNSTVHINGGTLVSISGQAIQNVGGNIVINDGLIHCEENGIPLYNIMGSLKILGGQIIALGRGDVKVIVTYDSATTWIADSVVLSPEGAMDPQTLTPAVEKATITIKSAEASYTLTNAELFTGVRWLVYEAATGNTLANGVTASLSGTTLTLQGTAEEGGTYYVAAYDRANGKSISDRLALTAIPPVKAKAPAITKDLSSDEVTYDKCDHAAALEVTATVGDGGTITYEWYKNTENSTTGGTKLNVTTPMYTPATDTTGTTYYYCVVKNTISDNGDGGTKATTATTKAAKITVEKSATEKLAEAKPLAEKAIKETTPTNDIDVLKIVEDAIVSVKGVTPTWKEPPVITKATRSTAGSITGTIVLTRGTETVEVTVNMEIEALGLTVGNPGSGADYTKIQDAVAAASSGDKIRLITDIQWQSDVIIGGNKNLTLDLNGKTWTDSKNYSFSLTVPVGSTLTITDSQGGGMIEKIGKPGILIDCVGTCNIDSGTIKGQNPVINLRTSGTDLGTLNVNGGIILTDADNSNAINNNGGNVVIKDGQVSVTGDKSYAIYNWTGSVTISGGQINATGIDSKVILNTAYGATTSIADNVILFPEGAMDPVTTPTPATGNGAATINKGSASYTLKDAYGDGIKWLVYEAATGNTLASGVTASLNGTTLTLKGVTAGTYYVAAYDRANGKGESARLELTVKQPASAIAPIITKDLNTAEVIYAPGASATALDATATAGDGGTITYEWYKNTTNSTTGGTRLNVTTAIYTPSTDSAGTTYYYCVVTNTINGDGGVKTVSVMTSIAKITVEKKDNNNGNGNNGSDNGSGNNDNGNNASDKDVNKNGSIIKEPQKDAHAPATNLNNQTKELKDILFTTDELKRVAAGEDAKIILRVTDISESVSAKEKRQIENSLGTRTLGMYIDLSLYKQIGNAEETRITSTSKKLSISVEIPKNLRTLDSKVTRTYSIIRLHGGIVETLEGNYDPKTYLFTFETDRFSTYALQYQDTAVSAGVTAKASGPLLLKAKAGVSSQTLTYNKIKGADGYLIYGAPCGTENKLVLLASVSGDTVQYVDKKLKKATYYKYRVEAYQIVDGKKKIIASSMVVHTVTGLTYANPTKVVADIKEIKLTKGTSRTITCLVSKPEGKKSQEHTAQIRYLSSNKAVATVTEKGKIKAVGKGTCYVYACAQNGEYCKVKVTIE